MREITVEIDPGAELFVEMGLPDPAGLSKEEWERVVHAYWQVDADGRVGLTRARFEANRLCNWLAPACTRVAIVGSVRRRRARVKDIELLVEPKAPGARVDLFTMDTALTLDGQLEAAIAHGWLRRGDKNGGRMKTLLIESRVTSQLGDLVDWLKVDLFIVIPPAQWGSLMAIRTGPADYSTWLVTKRSQGGICPDSMRFHDGALWRSNGSGEEIVPTPDEDQLYQALGLAWTNPWDRVAGRNVMLQ